MIRIFAIHDFDEVRKSTEKCFEITSFSGSAMVELNEKGYGIYWVLNDFVGSRKKENLTHINYWFCDIDTDDKVETFAKLGSLLPLFPSFIIETSHGFHCYWKAIDATTENFEPIQKRIIEITAADEKCKDVLRLLRMPYMLHQKNPNSPFMCIPKYESEREFTEKQMMDMFGVVKEIPKANPTPFTAANNNNRFTNPENWERLFKVSEIKAGNRNNKLYSIYKWMQNEGLPQSDIESVIEGINNSLPARLSDWEISQILRRTA